MKATYSLCGIAIALLLLAAPVQASDEKSIARQLQSHQKAEEQLLHGLASGNQAKIASAAIDIVTSETYLQVSGFPGNDPRLLSGMYRKNDSPQAFAARVFNKRMRELTGFHADPGKAFLQTNFNKVESGEMP